MSNIDSFQKFAIGKANNVNVNGKNCVIYTRVSSREQALNNNSLETQLEQCSIHAERQEYNVCKIFGGTYESAKTDERIEFERMLKYVRKSKEKISTIVVWNFDRFSRSGANAIYLADQLRKQDISIESVTQPTDTFSPGGQLQQNIYFSFSQYENDLRRKRMEIGRIASLRKGNWVQQPPIGYDRVVRNGQKSLVINEDGEKIRLMFRLSSEGWTQLKIAEKIRSLGIEKMSRNWVGKILKNPFYAGMIRHKSIPGEVLQGNHEPIVSKKLFLRVNDLMSQKHPNGIKRNPKGMIETPLRHFARCHKCGQYLTSTKTEWKNKRLKNGQKVRYKYKNPYFYYKCPTKGCKVNITASKVNEQFVQLLDKVKLDQEIIPLAKKQLAATFEEMNASNRALVKSLKKQLRKLKEDIASTKKKVFKGEMPTDIYEEFMPGLLAEQKTLEVEIEKAQNEISNPRKFIDKGIKIGSQLPKLYASGDLQTKLTLQKLVFPDEIYFERESPCFRTPRINSIFALFNSVRAENGGPIVPLPNDSVPQPRAKVERPSAQGWVTLNSRC